MEQLSAQDATFLYVENEEVANHVGGLYIYDQSTAPGGLVTFKYILKYLESKLHHVPRYRQKLMHVPGDLDHPYWIDDEKFDIEYHVRHMALPKPGDWRQLCILTSRIYDRPLDMSRPLWVYYIVEGLDNVDGLPEGSFAVITKTHHAMIDGVSGTAMATALHNTEATSELETPPPWKPEPAPNPFDLLTRAYMKNITQPLEFMQAMSRMMPAAQRVMTGLQEDKFKIPEAIGSVPRSRFNGDVSGHKVIDGVSFDIADLKIIKDSVPKATLNDVILTIGGGALRRYLLDKNELPEESLITLSPVSVRAKETSDPSHKETAAGGGNEVSGMLVSLGTDIEDPMERLKHVHDSASNSKELTQAIGARTLTDISQFIPGVTMGLASRLASNLGLATQMQPIVNTVITNVPGPQFPLYFCSAKMVNQYSLGIVQDGLALFHGILSYDGKLTITAMSDRDVMPDPDFYRECMQLAFEDLLKAAGKPSSSKASPAKTSPAKSGAAKTGGAKSGQAKSGTKTASSQKTSTRKSGTNKSTAKPTARKSAPKKNTGAKRRSGGSS
ncbi:MAG: wax ester/triacylglycerol synthase family O-acyltransferase [Alphaproteobacteria bacterium]|nr:wax ester/triacylglycerol synthase family O-acyltransferase [Alphaproteobacteria bacterium]